MSKSRHNLRLIVLIPLLTFSLNCASSLILPPTPAPYTAPDTTAHVFTRDGLTLEAFIARRPATIEPIATEPAAFILRFTGGDASASAAFTASRWNDSPANHPAHNRAAHNRPVEVWAINYPGYGRSAGPKTLDALARAAVASFDELKARAGGRPIFLEGFSLGTVPALCVAARRPVAGLILQNPPPLKELILGQHGWWNLWLLAGPIALQLPANLDSLANASHSTAPALFLLAEKDRTIPLAYQRQLFDAYNGPKKLILQKDADHFAPLTPEDEANLQSQINWLQHPQTPRPLPQAGTKRREQ